MNTKGLTIWILSTLTFLALIHTIDAAIALIFHNPAQLTRLYPVVGQYLTQIPTNLHLYISVALTTEMWGLTCLVTFDNPLETFLKESLANARAQMHVEETTVEKNSDFFELMYKTMEDSKGELARNNDLVLNLRAEIKDMQKVEKTLGKTNAAIADLEKQVRRLEEKTIFPFICKSCGKPVRADFNICPYCGLEINFAQEAVVSE